MARAGERVWDAAADTVTAKIYGPHLEDLARQWILLHAGQQTLGGIANAVLPATRSCTEHKTGHELDAVAIAKRPFEADTVLAVAEAKSTTKTVGHGELARLEHLRDLVAARVKNATDTDPPKLVLFSRSGFTSELKAEAARRDDIGLVDIERLYHGS